MFILSYFFYRGTFSWQLVCFFFFLMQVLCESLLRGRGSVRKRHLRKNQVKFLFLPELYLQQPKMSPTEAQRWTRHQDEGKFPSLRFEVSENCGTSAGSQFTLLFLFFFFFFLAKSTLKLQTWKQMVPWGKGPLSAQDFLLAYPVVYIHIFFQKLLSSNTSVIPYDL